jgi:magnesium chelatase subunit H
MPKLTSVTDAPAVRVVIVTLDSHLSSAAERARQTLLPQLPGLEVSVHAASEWGDGGAALDRCRADIERGDIVIATMLFIQDHIKAVLPALEARRERCDAMVACMSSGEVMKLTRMGSFSMAKEAKGPLALLKRLRGKKPGSGASTAGERQMKMLRRLPKILRFIPGPAQDVRAYFLTLQYWLGGSEENLANLIRFLVGRYADGPRRALRGTLSAAPPGDYPDVGLYHPRLRRRIGEKADALPKPPHVRGTVGLLLLRSYPLANNAGHYDGVINALEARGLRVIPAFSSGLDSRPAVEKYFLKDGRATVDAVVSLTGFSLVGGPAYNDAAAAQAMLTALDVPCIAAQPVEFQTLEQWGGSERGLMPVENTIMVAIPELDGSTGPMVFGGRTSASGARCVGCERACTFTTADKGRDMHPCAERAEMLAARVDRLIALRRSERAQRKVAIVLFNFPPNAGNVGTAAYLSVFQSLQNTLRAMKGEGYAVEVPDSVDSLRERVLHGNAARFGASANVHTRIPASDHVRRERWLNAIEAQWGPAPGKQQSDGSTIFVLGERFGNVFVGIQPSFGYEGDPMRLLFEKGFAPTHAFSAFYRWLREDFKANAVLHFGTHGALEFMPGKQGGLSGACWPDRLIGDLPNFYLYASNNPSEGAIAKRRSAATLISYLTPPVAHAGLYRGLLDLKASLDHWRGLAPDAAAERAALAPVIQAQAAGVELSPATPEWPAAAVAAEVARLTESVLELEYTLIPHGLHVMGEAAGPETRADLLAAIAEGTPGAQPPRATLDALARGATPEALIEGSGATDREAMLTRLRELAATNALLGEDHELPALMRALDGRYIPPAPGGDVLRTPAVLPTGRNIHGFDPFKIPSAFALIDGARQATRLLERHVADGNALPESIALVLWGTDNLKSEGGPIGQALALMGAEPSFDGYGRLCGARLTPLETLGRPRIDVVVTLSGIFRDLLPLQTKLLAEASFLAASADEPLEQNFVRKHALEYQRVHGCDLETAALRVFGNADGTYGANVNHLVENSRWNDEDELAETYTRRKSFAYTRTGCVKQQTALLQTMLADVQLAYQNLDSVELGVTAVDTYFDMLGGIGRAVKRARGGQFVPIYISDQTRGEGAVRSLKEQVSIETRTRMLNPKWYEGMLSHGYEGVRQIEVHVTNTLGWSATTGEVAPWVYQEISKTFVLDPEMRRRLSELNPTASAKVASRLIEAHERNYWTPDAATLEALRDAGEELEDRLEGIYDGVAA